MDADHPDASTDCPVRLLIGLWGLTRDRQGYVFTDVRAREAPTPLAEGTVRTRLKEYLGQFLPPEKVERLSSHSLRKGGATEAVAAGIPMPLVKAQGRWRSDAVYAYALTSDPEVLTVTQKMYEPDK